MRLSGVTHDAHCSAAVDALAVLAACLQPHFFRARGHSRVKPLRSRLNQVASGATDHANGAPPVVRAARLCTFAGMGGPRGG
jgi:hypothetical protein